MSSKYNNYKRLKFKEQIATKIIDARSGSCTAEFSYTEYFISFLLVPFLSEAQVALKRMSCDHVIWSYSVRTRRKRFSYLENSIALELLLRSAVRLVVLGLESLPLGRNVVGRYNRAEYERHENKEEKRDPRHRRRRKSRTESWQGTGTRQPCQKGLFLVMKHKESDISIFCQHFQETRGCSAKAIYRRMKRNQQQRQLRRVSVSLTFRTARPRRASA